MLRKNTNTQLALVLLLVTILSIGELQNAYACCIRHPVLPIELLEDHITATVTDQVLEETMETVFYNPSPSFWAGPNVEANNQAWAKIGGRGICPDNYNQEAVYQAELEAGAIVDKLDIQSEIIDNNGKKVTKKLQGEVVKSQDAAKIYMDLVRQNKDSALLEYLGGTIIRAKIGAIPPQGTVRLIVKFTKVLKKEGDLVKLSTLNTNPKSILKPLRKASFTCTIKSKNGIKNIYSPTHPITIVEDKSDVKVAWKQDNYLPKFPITLYYAVNDGNDLGINMMAHKQEGERGFFMLAISPTFGGTCTEKKIIPKDVIFCVDTSSSMLSDGANKGGTSKIEQAKAGLKYCVNHLYDVDRFNIVDFSTDARAFSEMAFDSNPGSLLSVDEAMRKKAVKYIDKLQAKGGTAIEEALVKALKFFDDDPKRLRMIIFMTDGMPTVGERDPDKLTKIIKKHNSKDARIYVFGEGYDVNTKLLEVLSGENKGLSDYILPEEKVEERLGKFYDKISSPALINLKVAFKGQNVKITEFYPKELPDLFNGDQIIVFGLYEGKGVVNVELTGTINGQSTSLPYSFSLPEESNVDFLPRLWAGRKIGFLLSEIKKSETGNDELIKEVIELSQRYGILTPYTSYLIVEDHVAQSPGTQYWSKKAGDFRNKLSYDARTDSSSYKDAREEKERLIQATKELNEILGRSNDKQADLNKLATLAAKNYHASNGGNGSMKFKDAEEELKSEEAVMKKVRYVGNKTFYRQSDGFWYDSTFEKGKDDKNITELKMFSDEFFKLMEKHPELGKYMTLDNVVLKTGSKVYKIEKPKE